MPDFTLYLVTDRDMSRVRGTADIARPAVSLPPVGIGGVGSANTAPGIRAGCAGIAVVSAADSEKLRKNKKTISRARTHP